MHPIVILEEAPLEEIITSRHIWVGDNKEEFLEWVKSFDEDYQVARIKGFALDLTGGKLWAQLYLSDISDKACKDITLQAINLQSGDGRAANVFRRFVRTCGPTIVPNHLSRGFDPEKWPAVQKACDAFVSKAK
jgi:hypothetical protein